VFRLKTEWPVVSRGDPGARGRTTHVGVAGGDWKAVETPDGLAFWQVLGDHPDLEPRIASLEGGTVLLAPAHAGAAVDWPDGHVVCDCHQIPVSAVRRAWADGARSLGEVGRRTQAGTSCGNCHPRLLDLSAKSGVGVRWSRAYRRPRSRGWSWRDILGYVIDYGMLVTGLLTALTGVLKMPGFLEAVGLDQRSLPDEANMALSALLDLHDWPGIALTVLALVHAALHWGMMTTFAKSWFRKR
jgi:bacterioferritin-associated ferredoxin